MLRLWILPVLGLIAVLGLACGDSGNDGPQSVSSTAAASAEPTDTTMRFTATAATTTVSTPSAPPTSVGKQTYTDPTYGYAFDYPASWYLSPAKDTGGDVTLRSYDASTAPPEEHIPNDKLKVTIRVVEGVDKSIEQWLADSRNDSGQPPVVVLSNSDITLGGKAGVAEVLDDTGERVVGYYVEMGGNRLLAIGAAPADSQVWPRFELVLNSLRFTS